jgi:hypothetical protein
LSFHLFDFRNATPFRDISTGKHLKQVKVETILTGGNIFASANQLSFRRTSRKDDLESLSSLLIYMMHNPFRMPLLEFPSYTYSNPEHRLMYLKQFKMNYPLKKLCGKSHEAQTLGNFAHYAQQLDYFEKPNYEKFRLILRGLLMFEKQRSFEIYFGLTSKEAGILR